MPDYAWGHDCLKDFQYAMANSKLKGGEVKPFLHKFGEADFSGIIQQIADYQPDGLVTISWAGDMVTFLRQQKPYKLYDKIVGFHYGNSVGICKAMGRPDGAHVERHGPGPSLPAPGQEVQRVVHQGLRRVGERGHGGLLLRLP